jgi:hypothetical protein
VPVANKARLPIVAGPDAYKDDNGDRRVVLPNTPAVVGFVND